MRLRPAGNQGFVIPLVVVGLLVSLSLVAMYNSTLREQRGLDQMSDADMRSYYAGEAGFQTFLVHLRTKPRYEDRFFAPALSATGRQDFNTGSQSHSSSYFQWFVDEIREEDNFSHLFVLVRGVLEYKGGRNVTILKSELSYSPPPPTPEGVTPIIIVESRSVFSKQDSLKYINNPRYRKLFETAEGLPGPVSALLDFLSHSDIEDIDFATQGNLLQAISQIETVNRRIDRLRSFFLAANEDGMNQIDQIKEAIQSSHMTLIEANSALPPFSALDPMANSASGELDTQVIQGLLDKISPQQKDQAQVKIFLRALRQSKFLTIHNPSSQGTGLFDNDPASELANRIESMAASGQNLDEILTELHEAGIGLKLLGHPIQLKNLARMLNDRLTVKGNGPDNTQGQRPPPRDLTPPALSVPESVPSSGYVSASSAYSSTSTYGQGPTSTPAHSLEALLSDPNLLSENTAQRDEVMNNLLDQLYTEDGVSIFKDIDENQDYATQRDATKGFLNAYLQRLKADTTQFVLQKRLMAGRRPTAQEMAEFRSRNPVPSRKTIEAIGKQIDTLVNSNQFKFYQNAHVSSSPINPSAPVRWTQIEISKEIFHKELILKLTNRYPLPRNNQSFVDTFNNSTWGDSQTHASIGIARDEYGNKKDARMFLVDAKTGEKTYLNDYLQKGLQ